MRTLNIIPSDLLVIVEVEVVGYMTVVRDEGENKIFRREKGQDDDNRFNAWR